MSMLLTPMGMVWVAAMGAAAKRGGWTGHGRAVDLFMGW